MNLRDRLRDWKLRLGLGPGQNPHAYRGPTHEDMARERSYFAGCGIAIGPDEDPFDERFDEQRAEHGLPPRRGFIPADNGLSVSNPRNDGQDGVES